MLTERRRQVLEALVHEYIAYATPVGSRTLAERYDLGFSPATIRNELATLEETGYLSSPHTSSGRIPTDAGYRCFVDSLLSRDDDVRPAEDLDGLAITADEADDLFTQTCAFLSRVTDCLSVVLAPSFERVFLKRITLVSLSPRNALIVLVTENGQVENRHVFFSDEVDAARLSHIEELFNSLFGGRARTDVCSYSHEDVLKAAHDPIAALVLDEVIDMLVEHGTEKVRHLGISSLLAQPEFSDSRHAIPVVMLLEDDATLVSLLDGLEADEDALTVRIGHEMGTDTLRGLSVVLKSYDSDGARGLVSVIGPTRMDYAKAIPAVEHVSHIFERTL